MSEVGDTLANANVSRCCTWGEGAVYVCIVGSPIAHVGSMVAFQLSDL